MSLEITVLFWMLKIQPVAPWRDTYGETASAIATACETQDDPMKCAATLTAIAWYESTFRPDAIGDSGRAWGLFQIHGSRHDGPREQAFRAVRIVRHSVSQCRDLTLYTSGRCGVGRAESVNRMRLARDLYRDDAIPVHVTPASP